MLSISVVYSSWVRVFLNGRLLEEMSSFTASWMTQQQNRASLAKAPAPELPSGNRCAGQCTTPVPPLPPGIQQTEGFGLGLEDDSVKKLIVLVAIVAVVAVATHR